jgi:hypothetical protein
MKPDRQLEINLSLAEWSTAECAIRSIKQTAIPDKAAKAAKDAP